MNAITHRLIAAGVLFLVTTITGMILSQSSRPLNIGVVTVHKLMAAGSIVLLAMVINQLFRTVDGNGVVERGLTILGAMSFIALIGTGALLTREEMDLPPLVLKLHRTGPLLAAAVSTLTVYLMR